MSKAYYNEIDPFAAEWLRNLIAAGHIAAGEVDERSIEDVTPDDLRGFTQCHFFAGIGGWSYALRLAGWPDNRPIWTGSCPCQPFSAPGKGTGFADDRHLWPSFRWLIQQCSPEQIAGEQVAGGRADVWFDLVHHDVERMGYSFGLTPFPAASVGTPNERERAYWVADSNLQRKSSTGDTSRSTKSVGGGQIIRLADSAGKRLYRLNPLLQRTQSRRLTKDMPETAGICATGWMGNTNNAGLERFGGPDRTTEWQGETGSATTPSVHHRPLEVNGFWRDADWLFCRDGKWRPVEPGTFPLVNGFSKGMGHSKSSPRALAGRNRVGRLKGYGNAINVYAAAAFIRAYMDHSGYDLI